MAETSVPIKKMKTSCPSDTISHVISTLQPHSTPTTHSIPSIPSICTTYSTNNSHPTPITHSIPSIPSICTTHSTTNSHPTPTTHSTHSIPSTGATHSIHTTNATANSHPTNTTHLRPKLSRPAIHHRITTKPTLNYHKPRPPPKPGPLSIVKASKLQNSYLQTTHPPLSTLINQPCPGMTQPNIIQSLSKISSSCHDSQGCSASTKWKISTKPMYSEEKGKTTMTQANMTKPAPPAIGSQYVITSLSRASSSPPVLHSSTILEDLLGQPKKQKHTKLAKYVHYKEKVVSSNGAKFVVRKQFSRILVCPVCDKAHDGVIGLDRHYRLTRHGQCMIFGTKYEHMEPYKQAIAHLNLDKLHSRMKVVTPIVDMEQEVIDTSCLKHTEHEAEVNMDTVNQNVKDQANSIHNLENEPQDSNFKDLLTDVKEEKYEIEHPDADKKELSWFNIKQELDSDNDSEIKEEIVCHNQGKHDKESSQCGDIKAAFKALSHGKTNAKECRSQDAIGILHPLISERTEPEESVNTQSMLFSERELKFLCLEITVVVKNKTIKFPRDVNGESIMVTCTLNPAQCATLRRMSSVQESHNPVTVLDKSVTDVDKPQPNGDVPHMVEEETDMYDDIPHNHLVKPSTVTLDEDHTSKTFKDIPNADFQKPALGVSEYHTVDNTTIKLVYKLNTIVQKPDADGDKIDTVIDKTNTVVSVADKLDATLNKPNTVVHKSNTVVNTPYTKHENNPHILVRQHPKVKNKSHQMVHKAHTQTVLDTDHTYKCHRLEDQSPAVLNKSQTQIDKPSESSQMQKKSALINKLPPKMPCTPNNVLKFMSQFYANIDKPHALVEKPDIAPFVHKDHTTKAIQHSYKVKPYKHMTMDIDCPQEVFFTEGITPQTNQSEKTYSCNIPAQNVNKYDTHNSTATQTFDHFFSKNKPLSRKKQIYNVGVQTLFKGYKDMAIDMDYPHEVVFPEVIFQSANHNHSDNIHSCNIATQTVNIFESQKFLFDDRVVDLKNFKFDCFICMEKFVSEDCQTEHMFLHHQFNREKCSFFLNKDDYALINSNNLEKRCYKSKVLFSELLDERKKYKFSKFVNCFVCGKEFSRKLSIIQHILQSHFKVNLIKSHFKVNLITLQQELKITNKHDPTKDIKKITNKLQGFIHWENKELEEQVTYSKKECVQLLWSRNNIDLNWFQYECVLCKVKYIDKESLDCHKLCDHENMEDLTSLSLSEKLNHSMKKQLLKDRRKRKKEKGICYFCGEIFKNGQIPSDHLKLHEDENSFQCEICKIRFSCVYSLASHRQVHTVDQLGVTMHCCEICGKTLKQKSLKLHMAVHTGERCWKCTICKKMFAKYQELIIHRKEYGHNLLKNHKCTVCGAKFTLLRCLKIHHLRKHFMSSGHSTSLNHGKHVKKVICNCGKVCASKYHHDFHVKTAHMGEPLPKCKICSKSFSSPEGLSHHKKIHTTERSFECDICHIKFRTNFSLRNHRRIHTGEKPFPCRICGVKFRQQGDRGIHENRHVKRGETTQEDLIKARSGTNGPLELSSHSDQGSGDKPVAEKPKGNDENII